jgi:hypothetical protein
MFISKRRSLIRRITWAVIGCTITVVIGLSPVTHSSAQSNNYVAANSMSGFGSKPTKPRSKPKPRPTPTLEPLVSNTIP